MDKFIYFMGIQGVMGINEEHGLEVRVIEEATKRGIKEYRLALTNPSELGFTWFERGGKEKVVKKQKAEALWKEYNPILREKIRQFSQFREEGAFLKEIADIFEIDYTMARSWKETTAKHCNVKPLLRRKGPRKQGPWHSIPIGLVSYMLCYYMPQIEGWKIPYDIAKDNDVSMGTIVNMCKEPGIEIIERKKIFISPLGEQVIAERLGQKKAKGYVIKRDGKDHYSIPYASRQATAQRGFEEGTEAFDREAERRYKTMLWAAAHCLAIKHEDLGGRPYVDRKNLDLLCDLISQHEAERITGLPKKEIASMMGNGVLPSIPGDKADFTRWSAVSDYVKGEKTESKAEIEPAGRYSALLETNQLLSTRLEQTTGELRKLHSEISALKQQVSTYEKSRATQKQLGRYAQLESKVTSLQEETKGQKKVIGQLEKRGQSLQNQLAEARKYKRTAQQLEKTVSRLQTKLDAYEKGKPTQVKSSKEIADLKKQINRLTRERDADLRTYQQRETELTERRDELEAEAKEYHKGAEKLETRVGRLETQNENLQIQLSEAKQYKRTAQQLNTKVGRLERQERDLKKQLTEAEKYQSTAQKLETKVGRLQTKLAEAEASKKEILDVKQRLTKECTVLRARAKKAEKAYTQVQGQPTEYANLESQLNYLQTVVKKQETTINQDKQRIDELGSQLKEAEKYRKRAEQLETRISELEIVTADYEKLKSIEEELSKRIADLRKQRTDTQKYDRQIKELTDQLTAAKSTIREKQKVIEEQDRMIVGWRRRYSAETKEYFFQLAGQVSIIEEALSKGKPPEENQIADLRSYLNRARHFQPQATPSNSDCSPAVVAQSITTYAVSDVLIWYGKWRESKEQRFVANLTKYFNALASELRERCKK